MTDEEIKRFDEMISSLIDNYEEHETLLDVLKKTLAVLSEKISDLSKKVEKLELERKRDKFFNPDF